MAVDNTTDWGQTIKSLSNERDTTEHNDYHEPKKQALLSVRKRAVDFMAWILAAGTAYLRQTRQFPTLARFRFLSEYYIRKADSALDEYGSKTPYSVGLDLIREQGDSSCGLKPMRDALESELKRIKAIDDLTENALDALVGIVRETERLDGRESAFLTFNTCPRCGGHIVETQSTSGAPEMEDHFTIHYRVGCDKCDYELMSDTVDV